MIEQFNFEAYHRKVEQIMARTGGLKGVLTKEYIPVTQSTLGDFCVECEDRRRLLDLELEGMTKTLAVDTDYVPYLEPWHGVGVYSEAFGCPFEWREKDSPWSHPIVKDIDGLKRLEKPVLKNSKMLNFVNDTIEFFDRQTRGQIPISLTDTQSPLDNATLICDTTFFFMSAYEYPDQIKQLIQWITDLMIESSRRQRELARNQAKPGHIMWSPTDGRGLSISEDDLVMIGSDFYEEFAKPYNMQLAQAFGGLAVHSCGHWNQHFGPLSDTPGVFMCDLAMRPVGDPNPHEREEVFNGFAARNTLVQIRTEPDSPDPDRMFAWVDRLRGPGFPMIIQIPFNEDPKIANRNYCTLRKKLDALLKRDW
jgi:hypothetical protein